MLPFILYIKITKKPRFCSCGKKSICGENFISRTHELTLLTLLTLLLNLRYSRRTYSTHATQHLTYPTNGITVHQLTQPTIHTHNTGSPVTDLIQCGERPPHSTPPKSPPPVLRCRGAMEVVIVFASFSLLLLLLLRSLSSQSCADQCSLTGMSLMWYCVTKCVLLQARSDGARSTCFVLACRSSRARRGRTV